MAMPSQARRGYASAPPPGGPLGASPRERAWRARKARTFRRVLAVPFWGLLAFSVSAPPVTAVHPSAGWIFAQVVGPVLLAPIAALRAIPTGLFLNAVPGSRRTGCAVGVGLLVGTFLLTFTAGVFGPALTPTVAATATVAECHRHSGQGHNALICTGAWTADGTAVRGEVLPVDGTPGSTVPIQVATADPYSAFAPLTGGRLALGIGTGLLGLAVMGASLFGLATHTLRVNRQLREAIAAGGPEYGPSRG